MLRMERVDRLIYGVSIPALALALLAIWFCYNLVFRTVYPGTDSAVVALWVFSGYGIFGAWLLIYDGPRILAGRLDTSVASFARLRAVAEKGAVDEPSSSGSQ